MSRKRIRAHANPLSDVDVDWPLSPAAVPWSEHYPSYLGPTNEALPAALSDPVAATDLNPATQRNSLSEVRIADIGCGFGGMSIALSEIFPEKLVLGMEIRVKVVEIVQNRINKLRKDAKEAKEKEKEAKEKEKEGTDAAAASASASSTDSPAYLPTQSASPNPVPWAAHAPSYSDLSKPFTYENVSVVKTNFMKYAVNFFHKGQLDAMFVLFADPHWKKSNHRRRVIGTNFLANYAYVLREGGLLYTITDVKVLHEWEVEHLDAHPLFERVPDEQLQNDPAYIAMHAATEESQKVKRLHGSMWAAVYRRIAAKDEAIVEEEGEEQTA